MSVWLQEILENAGYDIVNNPDDAKWLLSQRDEFGVLCEKAEECVDDYDEYQDYMDGVDDNEHQAELSFEDWRKENK